MAQAVKPAHRYDSALRREQAKLTRRSVLDAARRLFLARGYPGTTIAAVAEAGGVSVATVYKLFGNKARLLKGVFDVAIVGDDEPIPMLQRELVAIIHGEPDPRRKLRIYGEHLASAGPRAGTLQLLIRSAAASHEDAAAVWEQMVGERLAGMMGFAQHLHQGGHLRPDISLEEAGEVLWTYNSVELYDLLVVQRGWEPERYGRWIADALIAALLPPIAS
ncbi:MAG TPA: helix-turn-helix domain-containing protein [Actinomycetota bacterium]|jgi:AcrR family transcriptional regulator|nr:helix-turn-helix domain-containing protein [Actinomycetota bacterium]